MAEDDEGSASKEITAGNNVPAHPRNFDMNSRNCVIDLTGSDNEDEDLKAAIALSLLEQSPQASVMPNTTNPTSNEASQHSDNSGGSMFLGLDRKQMEADRLARLKRKREVDTEERAVSPPPLQRKAPPQMNGKTSVLPTHIHRTASNGKVGQTSISSVPLHTSSTDQKTPYLEGKVFLTSLQKSQSRSISLSELLKPTDNESVLRSAFLSTFIVDFDWLFPHFDTRNVSFVLALHARGDQEKKLLQQDFEGIPNVRLMFPFIGGNVNCMHTKIMLLFYEHTSIEPSRATCRIVIPSANLTPADWGVGGVMENILFVVDLPSGVGHLPRVVEENTQFKNGLTEMLKSMKVPDDVMKKLELFNFTKTASLGFVHTIGGSHPMATISKSTGIKEFFDTGRNLSKAQDLTTKLESCIRTGVIKLSDTVRALGLETSPDESTYPPKVDFITSSMGNLKQPFLESLLLAICGRAPETPLRPTKRSKPNASVQDGTTYNLGQSNQATLISNLNIYFPSNHTVEKSNGGPRAAGTICFQSKWWHDPNGEFPRHRVLDCIGAREDGILMHSKVVFVRFAKPKTPQPGGHVTMAYAGWLYLGSANLSESAWGSLVKDSKTRQVKISCRNWESGVIIPVPLKPEHRDKNLHDLSLEEVFGDVVPVPIKHPSVSMLESGRTPWFFDG